MNIDNPVWTSLDTLSMALAFFVIDENNPVGTLVNRIFRTGFRTGGIVTVHTSIAEVCNMVQVPDFQFKDPVPANAGFGQVLVFTRNDTGHATTASAHIDDQSITGHCPLHPLSFIQSAFITSQTTSL